MVIIFICLIIVLITEILWDLVIFNNVQVILISLILTFISICRSFLDTTEKYLFEFNFVDPFKLIRLKGIIETILISSLYFFKTTRNEIDTITDTFSNDKLKGCIAIFLLFLYFILCGFKSIYRVHTIRSYSPMARALADSILDIFYIIYNLIKDKPDHLIQNSLFLDKCFLHNFNDFF